MAVVTIRVKAGRSVTVIHKGAPVTKDFKPKYSVTIEGPVEREPRRWQ